VLFGSDYMPFITDADWQSIPFHRGPTRTQAITVFEQRLVAAYWQVVTTTTSNGKDDIDMTPEESVRVRPCFCGHAMNSSLEWAVAWSLIGEWTCHDPTAIYTTPHLGSCMF